MGLLNTQFLAAFFLTKTVKITGNNRGRVKWIRLITKIHLNLAQFWLQLKWWFMQVFNGQEAEFSPLQKGSGEPQEMKRN